MSYLFNNDQKLKSIDLSSFNTSKVTDMQYMFAYCNSATEINTSSFDTSKVTTFYDMFYNCTSMTEYDLSNFNTSNVTNMDAMIGNPRSVVRVNLSNFDFRKYDKNRIMDRIFDSNYSGIKVLQLDNTKYGSNMENAFYNLSGLETISLKNVDTSNATTMYGLFQGCSSIETLNLSSFNTKNVTNMSYMFNNMTNLTTISVSDNFVVDQVTTHNNMFYNDTNLVGGFGTTYDNNYMDKTRAHYDYGETNPGYFDRENVTMYTVTYNANGGTVIPSSKDVVDGKKIGNLPTPTYDRHVFQGWKLGTTEGILVDEDFVVTSDITLVAQWRDATEYTITFNPNGGIVDTATKTVYEGEAIGELPNATRDSYYSTGWYTGLVSGIKIDENYVPSGNETLITSWKIDFENDSWEDIEEAADGDYNCANFNVGDTREIDLGEYGVHRIRLANCTTPPQCSDPNFSQTACGFVFEFDDIITKHSMNNANGSCMNDAGSWPETEMRRFVNNEIYNALPEDIKSSIIPTRVVTGIGGYEYAYGGRRANYVSEDKLYLLSAGEVWGNRGSWNAVDYDTAINQSRQLDYYAVHGVSTSLANHSWPVVKKLNGEAESWRLRTPVQRYIIWEDGSVHTPIEKPGQTIYANFSNAAKDGGQGRDDCGAHFQMGVSPAFRIGPKLGWELTNDKEPLTEQKWIYWLNKNEKIEDGWYKLDDFYGNKGNYYFENGYAKTGWHIENGNKYYLSTFDEDGNGYMNCNRLENTSKEIDGTTYTFDENGRCTNCN